MGKVTGSAPLGWALIALGAGSCVGLAEGVSVLPNASAFRSAVLLFADAAAAYGLAALGAAAVWCAVERLELGSPMARATACLMGPCIWLSLLPVTRRALEGPPLAIALWLASAAAVGALALIVLRRVVLRLPSVLISARFWFAASLGAAIAVGAVLGIRFSPATTLPSSGESKNLVLVSIDTLRNDRVGPALTPHLTELAGRGIRFLEVVAPAPLTCPSHATILTGRSPATHGSVHNGMRLAEEQTTLADHLRAAGYRSAAFVGGYTLKDEACGLGGRFDVWDDELSRYAWLTDATNRVRLFDLISRIVAYFWAPLYPPDRPARVTTDRAISWLHERGRGAFFLWVHYFDPHTPYEAPSGYQPKVEERVLLAGRKWPHGFSVQEKEEIANDAKLVAGMTTLYESEIRSTDAEFGRLLEEIRALGLDEETITMVVADHGESLGDHEFYFEHSGYLYEEELRVPWIVYGAGISEVGRNIEGAVALADVAPTALGLLGVAPGETGFDGHDQTGVILGAAPVPAPTYAAVPAGAWPTGRAIFAVRSGGWKLIRREPEWWFYGMRIPAREEFYSLAQDPRELRDLASDPGAATALAELRAMMAAWLQKSGVGGTIADPMLRERLKALGYLQ